MFAARDDSVPSRQPAERLFSEKTCLNKGADFVRIATRMFTIPESSIKLTKIGIIGRQPSSELF
jgi:hypothetical protein